MLDSASDRQIKDQIEKQNLQAWNLKDLNRDQAITLAEQALALSESIGYRIGWASAQVSLAFIASRMERFVDALEKADQAIAILKIHLVDAWLARAYFVKGTVYIQLGDRSLARDYFNQQLLIGQQLDNPELQALAHAGLGHYASYEDLAHAQQHFEQALELLQGPQNAEYQALFLYSLASLHFSRGDLERASQLVEASFAASQSIHLELHSVQALGLLGLISSAQGQTETALSYINRALEIANLQQPELIPMCLLQIGKVSMKAKLFWKALPVLKEALRLNEATGNLRRINECHHALAEYYSAMSQPKSALEHQRRSEELTERIRRY